MSEHDAELVQAVATEVARAEFWKRVGIAITVGLVSVILALGVYTLNVVRTAVKEIRATQKSGSPALKAISAQQDDIEAINDLILGCLDPNSECGRRAAADEAAQAGADLAA